MQVKDALGSSASLSDTVLKSYIGDLEDADLMRRPGEGCNHLAWQLGHLISSEVMLLESVAPGKGIELPEGFDEAHSKEAAGSDDASQFHDKATYTGLYDQVRAATKSALNDLSDEDLDQPAPESFRSFCPTVGDMFALIASHPMMHAGQFVIVRRQLGKPIVM